MRRGEVWWVDFDPARGGEIRKRRPAVIVSNDQANAVQNRVQVVPLTSSAAKVYRWEAEVVVDGRTSKAMADQIRTVSKQRVVERLGRIGAAEMAALEAAIRVQLGL